MRREEEYLADALDALRELRVFTAGTNEERFLDSPLEQSYLFHRLVIFGEAMARMAPAFQSKYPEIAWSQVIALRNRLVHGYFGLIQSMLWRRQRMSICNRIPKPLQSSSRPSASSPMKGLGKRSDLKRRTETHAGRAFGFQELNRILDTWLYKTDAAGSTPSARSR